MFPLDYERCVCGHSMASHGRVDKNGVYGCLAWVYIDDPLPHRTICACREFTPLNWITEFCTIPETINA